MMNRKNFYILLGVFFITSGILIGLWLCFYVLYGGGLAQIKNGIEQSDIAIGACKMKLCWVGLLIPSLIGYFIGCWFLAKE